MYSVTICYVQSKMQIWNFFISLNLLIRTFTAHPCFLPFVWQFLCHYFLWMYLFFLAVANAGDIHVFSCTFKAVIGWLLSNWENSINEHNTRHDKYQLLFLNQAKSGSHFNSAGRCLSVISVIIIWCLGLFMMIILTSCVTMWSLWWACLRSSIWKALEEKLYDVVWLTESL